MAQPGTNRDVIRLDLPNVTVRNASGQTYAVNLNDLSKMELCKACKIAFTDRDESLRRTWPVYSMDELRNALVTNTPPEAKEIQPKDPKAPITDKQANYIRSLARKAGTNVLPVSGADLSLVGNLTMGEASAEINALRNMPTPLRGTIPTPTPKAEWQTPDIEPAPMVPSVDLTDITERLDKMDARIGAVTSLMEDMRPQVHEIHIPERDVIRIEGRQHKQFQTCLEMIGAGLKVFLIGPPGAGKSFMCEQLALALGLEFYPISIDPGMDATEFFGYRDATGIYHDTGYSRSFMVGGLVLIDEMDQAHGGIASKLNNSIANRIVEFGGETYRAHNDWVPIAAANTAGRGATKSFVNAMELSPATRNRFRYLMVDYDESLETEITMAIHDHADTEKWLRIVRQYRRNAFEANYSKVYFTPRNSMDGASLLKIGWNLRRVTDVCLNGELTSDEVMKFSVGCSYA